MRKGISAPIVIILLMLFFTAVAGYYGISRFQKTPKVKGMNSKVIPSQGFSVVLSTKDAWDFYEYLCKDMEECEQAVFSGKRFTTVSGGKKDRYEILVPYTRGWEGYKYMKYFVKPAFGASYENFTADRSPNLPSEFNNKLFSKVMTDNSEKVEVFILPISEVSTDYFSEITTFRQN